MPKKKHILFLLGVLFHSEQILQWTTISLTGSRSYYPVIWLVFSHFTSTIHLPTFSITVPKVWRNLHTCHLCLVHTGIIAEWLFFLPIHLCTFIRLNEQRPSKLFENSKKKWKFNYYDGYHFHCYCCCFQDRSAWCAGDQWAEEVSYHLMLKEFD